MYLINLSYAIPKLILNLKLTYDQTLLSQDIALNRQINFAIKINLYKYDVNIIF